MIYGEHAYAVDSQLAPCYPSFMAKYNKGEVGGIKFRIRPIGYRNWLNLYKIIPYTLGDNVFVKITIEPTDMAIWWSKCTLTIKSDRPGGVYEDGSEGYSEFSMTIGANDKGWARVFRLAHPMQACSISCKLSLETPVLLGKPNLPIVSAGGAVIIEDLKVYSSHTVMAWVVGITLTIAVLIVGIWNLILFIGQMK